MFEFIISIAFYCGPRDNAQSVVNYMQSNNKTSKQLDCERAFLDCASDLKTKGQLFGPKLVHMCALGITPEDLERVK
jgi:hypothetical protein